MLRHMITSLFLGLLIVGCSASQEDKPELTFEDTNSSDETTSPWLPEDTSTQDEITSSNEDISSEEDATSSAECLTDEDCDDDLYCTIGHCTDDGTCYYEPRECNDGHPATVEYCDETSDKCVYDVAPNYCLIGSNGWEAGETNPSNNCEICDPTVDQNDFSPRPNGSLCEDGDPCTINDVCIDGICTGGDEYVCDDGNPCTLDGCDPATGCSHDPVDDCCIHDMDCSDDDVCNGQETCVDGNCIAGESLVCDDNNICNGDETCDPSLGCQNGTPPADCCTSDEECNNICWTSTCVNGTCSTPEPAICDDGDPCNGSEICDSETGCASGTPMDCNDNNPCTDDFCNSETGECSNNPIEECCTSSDECADGDACNGTEVCMDNQCISGTPPDCADGSPCTLDACDIETGGCFHEPIDGCCTLDEDCMDDDPCTLDVCFSDSCQHLAIESCCTVDEECDDDVLCTVDACVNNTCLHLADDTLCQDDDVCTIEETCNPLTGCMFEVPDCSDGNPCTDDLCLPEMGCTNPTNSDSCDDGDDCTINDACNNGTCTSGSFLDCDDGNPCTEDICIPHLNSCNNKNIPGCTP